MFVISSLYNKYHRVGTESFVEEPLFGTTPSKIVNILSSLCFYAPPLKWGI